MDNQPQVEVLLATFNGERHLREQVESLLNQAGVEVSILARDDGSQDATCSILTEISRTCPEKLRLMAAGAPTGSAKWNFLRLMKASTGSYVALADQDDVWLPDKLSRSAQAMAELERQYGPSVPLLVFTDLRIVGEHLDELHASFWNHQGLDARRIASLRHLLAQNVLAGCTALMNRALVECSVDMPEEAYMHDWWIALAACAFGHARALHTRTVLYRQHGSNAVGAIVNGEMSLFPRPRYHEKRREQWERSAHQAMAFLALHRDKLTASQVRTLEAYRRCETSPSRLVRVFSYLRHGLFLKGLRPNLARLWYLWDMKAAKGADYPAQVRT
jgi:glycosyltransferase involved in cell wall biosynthesis